MARIQDVSQIPRAVAETLAKSTADLQSSLRRARLGEGPLFIVCRPDQIPAARTASYAVEDLLERPTVVRTLPAFKNHTIQTVAAQSAVLALPKVLQTEDGQSVMRKARNRGAILWAFADPEEAESIKLAHGVLPFCRTEGSSDSFLNVLALHLTAAIFAVHAAKMLRPAAEHLQETERELAALPSRMDWLFSNLRDAVAPLATEIRKSERILLTGGGAYHAAALEAARAFQTKLGREGCGLDVTEIEAGSGAKHPKGVSVLFLSGSRCQARREIHEAASQARTENTNIFSITDNNDAGLISRSARSLLVPVQPELTGALLALALGLWVSSVGQEQVDAISELRPRGHAE